MKPIIDPERDLKGATPEKLARARLKQSHLRPRPAGKPVVSDEVAVQKVAAGQRGHRVPHLNQRSRVPDVVLAGELGGVAEVVLVCRTVGRDK